MIGDVTSATQTQPRRHRLDEIESKIGGFSHRRVPRELRRRHLIELAAELFAERGYEAASMDELGERAGVSKPVIYDQFGSKEGLFVAVIEDLGLELNQVVSEAVTGYTDPEELLRSGSLAFFRFVGERRGTWAVAFGTVRTLGGSSVPVAEKLVEIRDRQDQLVATMITLAAHEAGNEPDPVQLGAITRGLNGVYEGMVEWWQAHPETSPEQLTDWVIDLLLPGLLAMAASDEG